MMDEPGRQAPDQEPSTTANRPAGWVGDAIGGPGVGGARDEVVADDEGGGGPGEATADDEGVDGPGEVTSDDEPTRSAAGAAIDIEAPPVDLAPGGRALPLRLARLHLRMGSLALARAELESFAGTGTLDEPALLDLAEARWRTGDLAGAGEAANAAIERGVDDPLAWVIAAEAVAGLGRPAEARRLAGHVLETSGATLDVLFAGMPRSLIWPGDATPDDFLADAAGAPGAAAIVRSRGSEEPVPASAAAAEAFAGGRGALARGDVATAALRLGVAIRLEPGFAQAALAAIGERASSEPVLALVAGDALRLLGREHEALAAFDVARGKPSVPGTHAEPVTDEREPEPAWPED